jgi:cyclic dehypoxanthinyl futalosine synthase
MGISMEQALDCFRSDDLVGIGMEADAVRRRLHPEGVVSYAIENNIDCAAAMRGDAGAGNKSLVGCTHRLFDQISETVETGGTGVRLLCGADRDMNGGIEWWEGLLRGIKQRFPAVWIEALPAAEVTAVAAGWGLGLRETIARLMDAGLDSIAGNGVDLVLGSVAEWVEVHRAAHGLGMRTAAGLPFGGSETIEARVDFLDAVRRLQEETGGFAAFAPMAAEAPNGRELDGVTAVERLKTLAIARMFLDNIENVQASATAQGLKVLQMGLRFGANDVGPVRPEAGSEEDVRRIIRDAGFRPAQRDMAYRALMLT